LRRKDVEGGLALEISSVFKIDTWLLSSADAFVEHEMVGNPATLPQDADANARPSRRLSTQ